MAKHSELPSKREHITSSRDIAALTLAAGTLAIGLSGCGPEKGEPAETTSQEQAIDIEVTNPAEETASAESTTSPTDLPELPTADFNEVGVDTSPSSTADETESSAETGLENVTREQAEEMLALPVDEFFKLSREKRLAATHLILKNDLHRLTPYIYSAHDDEGNRILDENGDDILDTELILFNPLDPEGPVKISRDNTAQEILNFYRYLEQVPWAQRVAKKDLSGIENMVMDKEAALKATSLAYYNSMLAGDDHQPSFESVIVKEINKPTTKYSLFTAHTFTATKASKLKKCVTDEGDELDCRDIEYLSGSIGSEEPPKEISGRFVYVPYMVDGQEFGLWQEVVRPYSDDIYDPDPNDPANQN